MPCEELLAVLATVGRSKGNWLGRGKPRCKGMRLDASFLQRVDIAIISQFNNDSRSLWRLKGSESHDPEEMVEMLCEELLAVVATVGRSKGNWLGRRKPRCKGMRLDASFLQRVDIAIISQFNNGSRSL